MWASANTASRNNAKYSQQWKYFNSVEDGSRVTKGWFKVVAAEYLDLDRYNDDEDAWYYADGSGNIYAGEFKTIKGKKYAFRKDGRMVDGLKFINDDFDVVKADNDDMPFDTEDDFLQYAPEWVDKDYKLYYFGDSSDGAMKTGKTNINLDGDSFNFYLEKSGSTKGAGYNGEKDSKLYLAGMMLKAGSDDKYQVAKKLDTGVWTKIDGAEKFAEESIVDQLDVTQDNLDELGINKKAKDIKELYKVAESNNYKLINTSGKIVDKSGKSKDGNDFVYVTKGENIVAIYVEK